MTAAAAIGAPAGAFLGVETSLTGKRWLARPADEGVAAAIARTAQIPDPLARVLAARGVTAEGAAGFLAPRLRDVFPDPSSFTDMDEAARLLWEAVEQKRALAVFGDYDVDGGTSAALLIRYFRALGVRLDLYVPDRIAEGYGPSRAAFETLKARGAEMVVTVDCGAAAGEALEAARELGLSVIVVDHHLMHGAPPHAAALVNPNRPGDASGCGHMAAAGVTFVLLAALNREGRRRGAFEGGAEPDILALLDLAALGTICDVAPLLGVNRAIVAQGLKAMGAWRNTGLRALARVAGVEGEPGVYHAGFLLGPRINAGGRVGRSDLGARLLSTDDEAEAAEIAEELNRLNAERRAIEAEVLEAASLQAEIAAAGPVIVAPGEGWHPGVIGVVAGRLKERHGRPALVIGVEDGIGKGSGRSVTGVNLGAAVAAARDEGLLIAGGGHAMAAGLTVEADRIADLAAFLADRLAEEWSAADGARSLKLDAVLSAAGATESFADSLAAAGPFGQGNPEPRFAFANMRAVYAERVGGSHVRFSLADRSGERVGGVAFRVADDAVGQALLAGEGALWHAAGRLKLNEWRGRRKVEFHLEDLAAAM